MTARITPPAATWLLKRTLSGPKAESLSGDLVEGYQRGRSRLWLWRQILMAIGIDAARDAAKHWLRAIGAVITGVALLMMFMVSTSVLVDSLGLWMWNWTVVHGLDGLRVFWFGRPLMGRPVNWTLLCLGSVANGALIAMCFRRRLSMVLTYAVFSFALVAVQVVRVILLAMEGFPRTWLPMPVGISPITLAVNLVGVPLFIVVGGLWACQSETEGAAG
jgi:hypothetical protein